MIQISGKQKAGCNCHLEPKVGQLVAVAYEDTFYVGEVVGNNTYTEITVIFMKAVSVNTFRWTDDSEHIKPHFVFARVKLEWYRAMYHQPQVVLLY